MLHIDEIAFLYSQHIKGQIYYVNCCLCRVESTTMELILVPNSDLISFSVFVSNDYLQLNKLILLEVEIRVLAFLQLQINELRFRDWCKITYILLIFQTN